MMNDEPRRVFILRHGETIEKVFGKNWINETFNEKGEYTRNDLNMPKSMPKFKNKHKLRHDSPITVIGAFHASLVGEIIAEKKIAIRHVFCSPALRCLQTCLAFLKGYGKPDMPVAIEPGYSDIVESGGAWPQLLTNYEINELGLKVRFDYQPTYGREIVQTTNETISQYYERQFQCAKRNITETKTGNILLITDPLTLTVNLHRLFRNNEPNNEEFFQIYSAIPSAALVELKEKQKTRGFNNNINSILINEEHNENEDDHVFFDNWENIDIDNMDIKTLFGIHYNKQEFNSTFKRLYEQIK